MATSRVPSTHARVSSCTARVLDGSRAIAAFAVLVQHTRLALLVDPAAIVAPNQATGALYFITGFGHPAVVVFFVLSGALIGDNVLTAVSTARWSWSTYLIRRLSRLYVVLVSALILILAWDTAGMALFPSPGLYGDIAVSTTIASHTFYAHNRDLATLIGNLAFLMTIYVPVLGSGTALWSLSNEFWYYILFPCIILAAALRSNSARSLTYVAIVFAIIYFVSSEIVAWMAVWLLGVAAIRAPRVRMTARRARRLVIVSGVGFIVLTALVRSITNMVTFRSDMIVGVGFALVLYFVFCHDSATAIRTPDQTAHGTHGTPGTWERLAGFSYTLYLFHQPPLAFANAWLVYTHHSRWQPTMLHVASAIAVALVVTAYSYVGSLIGEARTDNLRSWLSRATREPGAQYLTRLPRTAEPQEY